jgi:hypothetical protein
MCLHTVADHVHILSAVVRIREDIGYHSRTPVILLFVLR